MLLLDVPSLRLSIETAAVCKVCNSDLTFLEDPVKKLGLFTGPHLVCRTCHKQTLIDFQAVAETNARALAINRQIIFANKCIGGTCAGLDVFCSVLNLPSPATQKPYTQHVNAILDKAILQAKESMIRARLEIREHHDVEDDQLAYIIVSCEGTWKRRISLLFTVLCL